MIRPWATVPILDNGESLCLIPNSLHRLTPHPYVALGAPYVDGIDPFWLREGVVSRLVAAEDQLLRSVSGYRLAIFDAWRPIAVQAFMFQHAVDEECRLKGVSQTESKDSPKMRAILEEVKQFWASPSEDPSTPPPHSTGGAVDLTLVDLQGKEVEMGGEIDEISVISKPNYYALKAEKYKESDFFRWHNRRLILADVMRDLGFAQHPNEWWHFSYGDQLWAWSEGRKNAVYGKSNPPEIKSSTN
ncbi:M15 family metallopeptidase [Prochlorococcus sp. MIT 1341]|uniref:M15 family metallopeptidase n=1 Tax=Prochlorococcus sp. MIT 1341 TaxID=3096221 RepID=UPI002A75E7F9|nr:M15 family metallopeptidase [Prochlorococcus sp. MIT 1341]